MTINTRKLLKFKKSTNMKQIFFTVLSMLISTLVMAQSPQAFNYQGVARDLDGSALSTKKIALRVSILKDSPSGNKVYTETHHKITSDQGLFSLQIGKGESNGSTLDVVAWGSGTHFLQVEMDVDGGNDYQLVGTSELLSVPYALYAENGSKWQDSKLGQGLNYRSSVIIGEDTETGTPLLVHNTKPEIGIAKNTILGQFLRNYEGSTAAFNIYGYPKTNLVSDHLRGSIMLYASGDADDMVLCSNSWQGKIRFFTQSWKNPRSERMRIDQFGNVGIGTLNPKSKLSVADGDVYIQDVDKGVIMKSPDGNCWRMTVQNSGQPKFIKIDCPD